MMNAPYSNLGIAQIHPAGGGPIQCGPRFGKWISAAHLVSILLDCYSLSGVIPNTSYPSCKFFFKYQLDVCGGRKEGVLFLLTKQTSVADSRCKNFFFSKYLSDLHPDFCLTTHSVFRRSPSQSETPLPAVSRIGYQQVRLCSVDAMPASNIAWRVSPPSLVYIGSSV